MSSIPRSLAWYASLILAAGLVGLACGGSSGFGDGGIPGGLDGGGTGGVLGLGGITATGGGAGGSTAPACGQAGMPCCEGNACSGGGCCVAGICMAVGGSCVGLGGGTCHDGTCGECGGLGKDCCVDSRGASVCTAPSTVCNNGQCSPCGELGARCCASGKCSGASICGSNDYCLACGTPGSPCCAGNQCNSPGCCYENRCVAETGACGGSGTCQAGHCSGCGNASQPCCVSSCYDGLLCKSGSCTPCGGVDQECCPAGGATPACQAGTTCTSDGKCARCGQVGYPCCSGNACGNGCCQNGVCMAPSVCPQPDAGADAPLGGSDGNPGTGGVVTGGVTGAGGGAGGVTGKGGGGAGGVTGTGGVVGSGGTSAPWTAPAGCGDGVVTAPEQCDDHNTMPFDGCSSDCRLEPKCAGSGPCTSTCGDGLVVGEECDDGNTTAGDGCSTACKVEAGFTCTQPLGDRILVPAIYRDFKLGKPTDFEAGIVGSEAAATGMVKPDLDADGKPEYANPAAPLSNMHVQSAATFATWYRSTEGVNHATASKLALWDNHNGGYVNRYAANGEQWAVTDTALWCGQQGNEVLDADGNPIPCTYEYSTAGFLTDCEDLDALGYTRLRCYLYSTTYRATYAVGFVDGNPLFFPVDDDPFSASETKTATIPSVPKDMYDATGAWPREADVTGNDRQHNFSFTSEVRFWFKYEAGKSYTLDIVGDDDVWLFVNKKLAVDLGGIHTPVAGSVTLNDTTAATYGLTPGNAYEIAVFQAERQSTASTFKMTVPAFSLLPSQCQRN